MIQDKIYPIFTDQDEPDIEEVPTPEEEIGSEEEKDEEDEEDESSEM